MKTNRSFKEYAGLSLRGMAMGAADVVPGVSGGTIAFITGIYEELIDTIKGFDLKAINVLFKQGPIAFWKHVNGAFLLAVLSGIAISVVSLVKVIHYVLDTYPVLIWSFFFGLIIASALVVVRKVKKHTFSSTVALLGGIGIALFISTATPAETPNELWFVFLSGAVAICAMILPGVSGSFLLLLLRKYKYITGAIADFDIVVILIFLLGCGTGIIAFSHLLSYLFKRFHDATIALLTGFMLGSLNVVWPWKNVIEYRINSKGHEEPFRFESVLPAQFDGEPNIASAIACMTFGLALILVIEYLGNKPKTL